MNRRTYLSVVAALGFAGCSGGPAETTTLTTSSTATTTTTRTPTTEATATRTTTATPETTAETTTEEPETTATTETTETTSRAEGYARRQIEEAEADLDTAYRAYLDLAGEGNADPLAVTVDTGTFDPSIVVGPVGEAQIHLGDAENQGVETLEATIRNHRRVGDVLRKLARAQSAANSCYREYVRGRGQFFEWDEFTLDRTVETFDGRIDSADDAASTFQDTDLSVLSGDEPTPAVMEQKAEQLRRALSAFEFFREQFGDLADAMSEFDGGIDSYNGHSFSDASYSFDTAEDAFGDALDAIEDRNLPEPLSGDVADYSCVLGALEEGVGLLVRAADMAVDGNVETANRYAEDADEELEECDILAAHFDLVVH